VAVVFGASAAGNGGSARGSAARVGALAMHDHGARSPGAESSYAEESFGAGTDSLRGHGRDVLGPHDQDEDDDEDDDDDDDDDDDEDYDAAHLMRVPSGGDIDFSSAVLGAAAPSSRPSPQTATSPLSPTGMSPTGTSPGPASPTGSRQELLRAQSAHRMRAANKAASGAVDASRGLRHSASVEAMQPRRPLPPPLSHDDTPLPATAAATAARQAMLRSGTGRGAHGPMTASGALAASQQRPSLQRSSPTEQHPEPANQQSPSQLAAGADWCSEVVPNLVRRARLSLKRQGQASSSTGVGGQVDLGPCVGVDLWRVAGLDPGDFDQPTPLATTGAAPTAASAVSSGGGGGAIGGDALVEARRLYKAELGASGSRPAIERVAVEVLGRRDLRAWCGLFFASLVCTCAETS